MNLQRRVGISKISPLEAPGQYDTSALMLLMELEGTTQHRISEWLRTAQTVTRGSEEAQKITEALYCGQDHGYGFAVESIIRVARHEDWKLFCCDPNKNSMRRMMLWHGTKKDRLAGILRDGLKPPTGGGQRTNELGGQMFGSGIYFADRASKSANYCDDTRPGSTGYLFLCDVAVGKPFIATSANRRLTSPPMDPYGRLFDSVMGVGENIPQPGGNVRYKLSYWPLGPTVPNESGNDFPLRYNEYVVYDTGNIHLKYIIKFQFTQNPCSILEIY